MPVSRHIIYYQQNTTRGGSSPGKVPNRDRALGQGAVDLDKDYFSRLGLVSALRLELDFELRYRMPRALHERVRAGVLEADQYFEQMLDTAGVMGASADQKKRLRCGSWRTVVQLMQPRSLFV
jgi:hypothetical protein